MKIIPLRYVKGVGPQREELLKRELGYSYVHELLYHFPFRYIDRSRIYTLEELYRIPQPDSLQEVQVILTVISGELLGEKTRKKRFLVEAVDGKRKAWLVWFQGVGWISRKIKPGKRYLVFGKITFYEGIIQFAHPEIIEEEKLKDQFFPKFLPVYSTTEKIKKAGLDSDGLFHIIKAGIQQFGESCAEENLPEYLLRKYRLISRESALRGIHIPEREEQIQAARYRLKFEEFFFHQLPLGKMLKERKTISQGILLKDPGIFFKKFYEEYLPFQLTGDQKKVIREMYEEMKSGRQMNRLLQGDVGSGKTMVAVLLMLMVIGNGFQVCMMVPTEILAQQHFRNLQEYFFPLGIPCGLLTGSVRKKEKEKIYRQVASGELPVLVGTHALIEEGVSFRQLGLAVIDEQHRFGVAQRAKLTQQYSPPPHILIMSATPIPRTMALTLYGDLDVSVIRQMPEGRKPVRTLHVYENARLRIIGLMKEQIARGHQVYVVFPLIQESEKMDYHNLEKGYEGILNDFPPPQYRVGMVHGKMSQEERDLVMQSFAQGKIHILVATTVIEVGVNVPNATLMIIESAERFGLSQLHQLRGRVGRGSEASLCILLTGHKLSQDARKRIEAMVQIQDGFKISELDLELRGPGELAGTRQSGIEKFRIAHLMTDGWILQQSREAVLDILDKDPQLLLPEHQCIVNFQNHLRNTQHDWFRVG